MPAGRPKGSKNKIKKEKDMRSKTLFRVDPDIEVWLHNHKNMGRYINSIIRKDMEEQISKED